MRDLSAYLRSPANSMNGPEALPCAVDNVIALAYSQTGMLLRQFYFAGLNTKMVNSSIFDDGLVFEVAGCVALTPTVIQPVYDATGAMLEAINP